MKLTILSAEPLIVFTFFYFIVPEIFKSLFLTALMEILTVQIFQKLFQNLCSGLLAFARRARGVSESRMCIVNQVSKSCFISLLVSFSQLDIILKTLSAS